MPRWLAYVAIGLALPLVLLGAFPGYEQAFLNVAQIFTATQAIGVTAVSSCSGTVTLNLAISTDYTCAMSGSVTLANPSNLPAGATNIDIRFTQPSSGGPDTLAFGTEWTGAGGSTTLVLSTANNAVDFLACRSEGSSGPIYCFPPGLEMSH